LPYQLPASSFSPAYDFNAWNDYVLGVTDKAAHDPLTVLKLDV